MYETRIQSTLDKQVFIGYFFCESLNQDMVAV